MLFASLALVIATTPSPSSAQELPHQDIAEVFLADHDLTGTPIEEIDLTAVLEANYFRTRAGLFEVWMPAQDLSDKESVRDYRDICAALLRAQAHWIGWIGEEASDAKELRKALKSQEKWVAKWNLTKLMNRAGGEPNSALELFAVKEDQSAIYTGVAGALQSGAVLGMTREGAAPVRLVLQPHRKQFVEFLAFAGLYLPDQRGNFWVQGMENWSEFRVNDLQVIALEYTASGAQEGDYTQATSMKDRALTGLEEQVVQLGMNKLLAYEHGDSMPPGLISGLSINMIIELYGACHTRLDGDARSKRTEKREIFIRGGRSEGGELPQNVAESRWRQDYGKHHYLRVLKQVQRSGASSDKRNRHKYNSFLLMGDDAGARFIAHAPLLGPPKGEPESPPDNVYGDYREFVRAYKTGFLFWLRTSAVGSRTKSEQAFAKLLMEITRGGEEASLSATIEAEYGVPLSDPGVTPDSLEGQFVKWLAKQ